MSEATQIHIDLEIEGEEVETGFQGALNYIRRIAPTEAHKGRLFERLMQRYLRVDPIYKDLFTEVWLWKEWTDLRTDFDGVGYWHRPRCTRQGRWILLQFSASATGRTHELQNHRLIHSSLLQRAMFSQSEC